MNAIDLLVSQHREMEDRMKALTEAAPEARQTPFNALADLLAAHIAVEEREFYPAINAKRTEDILLESLEEHLGLKRFLADLIAMRADDAGFEPKFKVLKEQAEHHHKEEEKDLFPKARKLLDEAALASLGDSMAASMNKLRAEHVRKMVPGETDAAAPLK